MPTPINLIDFRAYLATVFPSARLEAHPIDFGDVYLRFELGDDQPNGSDLRVMQATERAVTLFQEVAKFEDEIILVINDWNMNRNELWRSSSPEYLHSLIGGFNEKHARSTLIAGDDSESPHRQTIFQCTVKQLDYSSIFRGIANLEQGRTPQIGESIYFINKSNNTIFYMYDDRGCLIYSDAPETLSQLYAQRSDWLVRFYRAHFDATFGDL